MATLTVEPQAHPQLESDAEVRQPTRRLFTVDEYYAMYEHGIIDDDERTELIEGEIIAMAPIGIEHEANVDAGTHILVRAFGDQTIVRVQGSLTLDDGNRPQPDLMLLKSRDGGYRDRPAGPADVLLIIEVSDSTLLYDGGRKLALYARHGIPEVWIENIPDRVIEAYSNPVNGQYTETRTYRPSETITPSAFPDVQLPVIQLVGAAPNSDEQ